MKIRTAATLVGLVVLAGCHGPRPAKTVPVSNSAYTVDQLFTDDSGCTVYRFYDRGAYHYYVVGARAAQMIAPETKKQDGGDREPDPS